MQPTRLFERSFGSNAGPAWGFGLGTENELAVPKRSEVASRAHYDNLCSEPKRILTMERAMHSHRRTKLCIAAAAMLLGSAFAGGAAAKQTPALEDASMHVDEVMSALPCQYDGDREKIGEIYTAATRIEALVSLSKQWENGSCSKAWAYDVLLDAARDAEMLPTFDDSRRNMLELVATRLSNFVLESSAGIGSYEVVLHSIANDSIIVLPEERFARELELREQIVEKTIAIVDSMAIYGEERDRLLMSFAATWSGFGEASSNSMPEYMWNRPTFFSGALSAWKAIRSSDNRYEMLAYMGHYLARGDFAFDEMILEVGLNHSLAALLADSGWKEEQIVSGSEAVVSAFCSTMREREPELQQLNHYDEYVGGGLLPQDPASHPWWGKWGCERSALLTAIVTHVAERGEFVMAENLILAAAKSTDSSALLVSLAETVDEKGMGADEQIPWVELIYALHRGDDRAKRRDLVSDVASARLRVGDTRTAAALARDVELVGMDTAVGILADISAFYAEKCEFHHAHAYAQAITDRIVRDPSSGKWGVKYAAEHRDRSWAYSRIARAQAECASVDAAV